MENLKMIPIIIITLWFVFYCGRISLIAIYQAIKDKNRKSFFAELRIIAVLLFGLILSLKEILIVIKQ